MEAADPNGSGPVVEWIAKRAEGIDEVIAIGGPAAPAGRSAQGAVLSAE